MSQEFQEEQEGLAVKRNYGKLDQNQAAKLTEFFYSCFASQYRPNMTKDECLYKKFQEYQNSLSPATTEPPTTTTTTEPSTTTTTEPTTTTTTTEPSTTTTTEPSTTTTTEPSTTTTTEPSTTTTTEPTTTTEYLSKAKKFLFSNGDDSINTSPENVNRNESIINLTIPHDTNKSFTSSNDSMLMERTFPHEDVFKPEAPSEFPVENQVVTKNPHLNSLETEHLTHVLTASGIVVILLGVVGVLIYLRKRRMNRVSTPGLEP